MLAQAAVDAPVKAAATIRINIKNNDTVTDSAAIVKNRCAIQKNKKYKERKTFLFIFFLDLYVILS
ncbi:MAG: hypothetical protein R3Y56_00435 [Akkermansia sp.]